MSRQRPERDNQRSARRFPKANPDARLRLVQLNCTFLFDERKLSPDPLAPKGFAIGSVRALPCAAAAAARAGPVLLRARCATPSWRRIDLRISGDRAYPDFGRSAYMRVLTVIALAMLLAGCEGDRIKQSKNPPPEQMAAFGLLA